MTLLLASDRLSASQIQSHRLRWRTQVEKKDREKDKRVAVIQVQTLGFCTHTHTHLPSYLSSICLAHRHHRKFTLSRMKLSIYGRCRYRWLRKPIRLQQAKKKEP
ncbi:PREDICTED: uncharacterized protein LOC108756053 [Trachymyrmex septentrionalis]|uniref:uncharacterized protein LOC108756053 n=1 Tax=Trachymyrmex septentrionalis TaxID=34720 RepID=UPI00084F6814|nr:PREDICTED: uncharacterized protein LOC108756053 [Trachymyrmex septentrionalis]